MTDDERARFEEELARSAAAGDLRATAARAIEGYGPEVLGFVYALLGDEDDAREVFSRVCEDLCVGLPGFRGEATYRTWLYTLARHSVWRFRRDRAREQRRRAPLSDAAELAARVSTTTLWYLKSEPRRRVAELLGALDREERALLVLRHDRKMTWPEIAAITLDAAPDELPQKAAALRKRYERLLKRLRDLYDQR